jgi:hypothetical protein
MAPPIRREHRICSDAVLNLKNKYNINIMQMIIMAINAKYSIKLSGDNNPKLVPKLKVRVRLKNGQTVTMPPLGRKASMLHFVA